VLAGGGFGHFDEEDEPLDSVDLQLPTEDGEFLRNELPAVSFQLSAFGTSG